MFCGSIIPLLLLGLVIYYAVKWANQNSTKPPAAAMVMCALLLQCHVASAQNCPGGVCPVPSRSGFVSFGQPYLPLMPTAVGQPQYQWKKHETHADNWVLWLGSQHVGTYRSDQGLYYPWAGTKFGDPVKQTPIAPPKEAGEPAQNFGMGWQPSGQDKWTAGGKEISSTAAARDLTDDSGRKFITGVLDKDAAIALRKEWYGNQGAAEFRDQYHLQVYEKGSPQSVSATDRGYTDGLYVLGSDGKELTPRIQNFNGLDSLLDTLRRLRDGGPLIGPKIDINVPTWVWVGGLLLLGYSFGKRSK